MCPMAKLFKRYGKTKVPLITRFVEKIKLGEGGCWLWTGAKVMGSGYGKTNVSKENKDGPCTYLTVLAHRASYELYVGDVPEDKFVLHKCDTPSCVNPRHLFLGTQQDNIRDCVAKRRRSARKLTMESAREIRRAHGKGGVTYAGLGRQFGVSGSQIRQVVLDKVLALQEK